MRGHFLFFNGLAGICRETRLARSTADECVGEITKRKKITITSVYANAIIDAERKYNVKGGGGGRGKKIEK